jgi:DNA-binding NtrC family response regulator
MRHKVLIATRQKDISGSISADLRRRGHEVLEVASIVDLLRYSDCTDISLIFLDLALFKDNSCCPCPGENGGADANAFVILRDCCGNIRMSRNHMRGNIETFLFRRSEFKHIADKIHCLLQKY